MFLKGVMNTLVAKLRQKYYSNILRKQRGRNMIR